MTRRRHPAVFVRPRREVRDIFLSKAKEFGLDNTTFFERLLLDRFGDEVVESERVAVARRLRRIESEVASARTEITTYGEALCLFVKVFLANTAEPDATSREAAAERGKRRFSTFLEQLREVLGDGGTFDMGDAPHKDRPREEDR